MKEKKLRLFFYPPKNTKNKYIFNILTGLKKNKVLNVNKHMSHSFFNLIAKILFYRFIKKIKIFHFNWILNFAGQERIKSIPEVWILKITIFLLKITDAKLVWTLHNKYPHETVNKKIVENFRRFLTYESDLIFIHCMESLKILKKIDSSIENKVKYIPMVNYIDVYDKSEESKEYFENKGEKFVLLFFGLIRKYKNVNLLIDVFNKFNYSDLFLLLGGHVADKNLKEYLNLISVNNPNIKLIDKFIEDNEVSNFMKNGDVMVLPFNKKSALNSSSMYLGLSYNLPVIISEIGSAIDLKEKEFVISYNYRDENEHKKILTQKIEKCYSIYKRDKDYFKKIGAKGREFIRKENSLDFIVKEMKSSYSGLLSRD